MKSIDEIKNKIYSHAGTSGFFGENTVADACFKLACGFEYLSVNLMKDNVNFVQNTGNVFDRLRIGFSQGVKDAFKFCKSGNGVNLAVSSEDNKKALDEIERASDFANVRNAFERYGLKRYNVSVENGKTVRFSRNNTARDFNAELYSRWVGKKQFEETERTLQNGSSVKLFGCMVSPLLLRWWDEEKQLPRNKTHFKKIVDLAYDKISIEGEEYGDFDFGTFTMEEFRRVYAVILALGVMKFNYHFNAVMGKVLPIDVYRAAFFMRFGEFKDFIVKNSRVKESAVDEIISYLIYDPQLHSDKVTVYQPLFVFGDTIFFSPSQVYHSYAQDKLFYLIKNKDEYQREVSRLAADREKVMTDKLIDFIYKNSNLLYNPNFKMYEKGKCVAEFDLLMYDEKADKVLLVELKWFFKAEGETEHVKVDAKLAHAIENRLNKQSLVKKDVKNFMDEAFGVDDAKEPEILSCIVSKNYSGSAFIEDKIPVFDEFLFISTLEFVNFDFNVLFDAVKAGKYLPDMQSLDVRETECEVEYAGYRIIFPALEFLI